MKIEDNIATEDLIHGFFVYAVGYVNSFLEQNLSQRVYPEH